MNGDRPCAVHPHADAAGGIDWLVQVDSTTVRAHQYAATGREKGGRTGRTNQTITPSADPEADCLADALAVEGGARDRPGPGKTVWASRTGAHAGAVMESRPDGVIAVVADGRDVRRTDG